MKFPLFPDSASTMSPRVDALYFALIGASSAVMLGILGVMVYFLWRYRRGKAGVVRCQCAYATLPLELTWTIVPLIVFFGFFVWGAGIYQDMQRVPSGALDIHVVGKQWMWKVQHPTGQREINELHVPIGRDVKLTLASQDVIHSFFIPAFRIKQDVVPGRYLTAWFHATRLGSYHLFCAEYCGKDHSRMIGTVHVLRPEAYEAWLTRGAPAEAVVDSGARLFREAGCSGCHTGNGPVRAPALEGLFGRMVPLMSREVILADEMYIHDSIVFPNRHITAGYEPLMPSYEGKLSEEQLFELVTYIKALGSAEAPVPRDLSR